MPKITMPHRTSSSDSDSIRKRVGKACDRCRLKKSKCDGSTPCSRCKADNAICVFGERKKSHDKVYPKGYVEMLEQQQSQLVAGLQETYRRLFGAQLWPGARLAEHNGKPLTHDILAGLNLLEMKQDGSGEMEMFEEDCQKLQQRLVLDGAPYVGRRGSFSSESDHDSTFHQSHARTSSHSSLHGTPISSHAQPVFNENWNFQSSPSPITLSPPPKMRLAQQGLKPSPLSHSSGPTSDDNYIMPSWRNSTGNINMASNYVHPQFTFQAPAVQDNLQTIMENYSQSVELAMDSDMAPLDFSQQFANGATAFGTFNPQDWMINESMEVDFSKFVQVST